MASPQQASVVPPSSAQMSPPNETGHVTAQEYTSTTTTVDHSKGDGAGTTVTTTTTTVTSSASQQQQQQPQILISDYPSHEDHAFRTKIDSSYEGWDNPFRPEGELSHEAEELLRLWKEGKLKQDPRQQLAAAQAEAHAAAAAAAAEAVTEEIDGKLSKQQLLSSAPPPPQQQQNGGKPDLKSGAKTVEVRRENVPHLASAGKVQHVNLGGEAAGEQKKKKNAGGCCSLM